ALDMLLPPMHVVVSETVKLVERYAVRIRIHVLQLESKLRQRPRFSTIKLLLFEPVRGQSLQFGTQNLRDAFYFLGGGCGMNTEDPRRNSKEERASDGIC